MVDRTIRAAQHRHFFYPHELAVLADVCLVLGKQLGDLTQAQARDYLSLFYTAPHNERSEAARALARLRLGGAALGTFLRYEFGLHASVPGFADTVVKLVLGDGVEDEHSPVAVPSLSRDLSAVVSVAKRGA